MAKMRLVAYRKPVAGSSDIQTYELDLQENPSVSLNFQFSDIKEPEKRKASYSQTFKLPFTDNNNEFFQNWFNVNLTQLVFSTREKFSAVLFYGTTTQFEGFIQLKSVYKKAQVYEVVLMSNTADLFSVIGEQRLKDVFLNDDGTYSNEFNHVFSATNLSASWGNSLQNTAGTSLYDSDAGVSKIVYPISITKERFYYQGNVEEYLNMNQTASNTLGVDAGAKSVDITQFRPAIQLRALFKLIIAKAGFSYTSDFIDGNYFGKLFMTTGNEFDRPAPFVESDASTPDGFFFGGANSQPDALYIGDSMGCSLNDPSVFVPFTADEGSDPNSIWDATYNNFKRVDTEMQSLTLNFVLQMNSGVGSCNTSGRTVSMVLYKWDDTNNVVDNSVAYWGQPIISFSGNDAVSYPMEVEIPIINMPVNTKAQIMWTVTGVEQVGGQPDGFVRLGQLGIYGGSNGWYNLITANYNVGSTNIYGGNVDIPQNIGENLTQKSFIKDIIERFNLVVLSDPEDAGNLIIKPYNDYIQEGGTKFWTDKLDVSKEVVVSDTTTLQKKKIILSDLDDNDLMNKSIREFLPSVSVYGKLQIDEVTNDFAKGELKNNAVFSPFINQMVFVNDDDGNNTTELPNMAVQYEIGYEANDEGFTVPKLESTKPKLFYYCGTATTVKDVADASVTYYLHNITATGTATAYNFTTYPVCTPYDITPVDNEYTLTPANKSLNWNFAPPSAPNLTVFNYQSNSINWGVNALYFLYWKEYLDQLYSVDARIMDCYLNLDAVDIFSFKFNDQIFIKDSYWRILEIKNYQVGANTSTKVRLIKILDTLEPAGDYVVSTDADGSNQYGPFFLFCPSTNPSCTPTAFVTEESCISYGGTPVVSVNANAPLYPCLASTGSLPISLKSLFSNMSLFSGSNAKSIIYSKLQRKSKPFVVGSGNTRDSRLLLPPTSNDLIIKYTSADKNKPQVEGEIHRLVLSGYTEGNTRGYAYVEGDSTRSRIKIPNNSNVLIRVNGTATVVGGTSATYVSGTTEGFAWYTAFKNVGGSIIQLSTTGGQQEFSIREGANPTTCTLHIEASTGEITFGLDDSQTDTKRVWSLSVELSVQSLPNLYFNYGDDAAVFQNSRLIYFQDNNLLIWN
jgi:hypothetical protein